MSRLLLSNLPPVIRQPGQPWTVAEAAPYLRLCERTLGKHIQAGRIRSYLIGRRRLISDQEIQRISQFGFGDQTPPAPASGA